MNVKEKTIALDFKKDKENQLAFILSTEKKYRVFVLSKNKGPYFLTLLFSTGSN